ncbi:MAG: hypothetical protein Q7T18_02260, partial [Sedimentisphaerales bacterium]|nr:hypothetical protein [Sedimentisphaerales bacterium]
MSIRFKADAAFEKALKQMGLDSIDAVFSFSGGRDLAKATLAKHRSRIKFELATEVTENTEVNKNTISCFLKRYDNVPPLIQIKNWLSHRRIASTMFYDLDPAQKLAAAGINTPQTVCYGSERGMLFEKRSFIITRQIPGESLERVLPDCFNKLATDFTDYTESKIQNLKS